MNTSAREIRELIQQLLRCSGNNDRMTCSCLDVTPLQGVILIELAENQPMSMQQIADRAHLTVSTMSRVVNKLVDRGEVTRQADENDRRIVLCALTAEGARKAQVIEASYEECFAKLAESISPGDLEGFIRGMRVIIQQMEAFCQPNSCSADCSSDSE